MTDLRHYSPEPFAFDRSREYPIGDVEMKPTGLWLSVGDAWWQWCTDNEWGLDGVVHVTEMAFTSTERILHVTHPSDVGHYRKRLGDTSVHFIDWLTVREEWGGILVDPWTHPFSIDRLGTDIYVDTWWYAWDCSSACVWDLSLVRPRS